MSATGTRLNVSAFNLEGGSFLGQFRNFSANLSAAALEAAQGASFTPNACPGKFDTRFTFEIEPSDGGTCRDTSMNVTNLTIAGADRKADFDDFNLSIALTSQMTDGGADRYRFRQLHQRAINGTVNLFDRYAANPAAVLDLFTSGDPTDLIETVSIDLGASVPFAFPILLTNGSLNIDDLIKTGLEFQSRGAVTAPVSPGTSLLGIALAGDGLFTIEVTITYDSRVLTLGGVNCVLESVEVRVANGEIQSLTGTAYAQGAPTWTRS